MPKYRWMGASFDSMPDNVRVTVERKSKDNFGIFQAVGPFSTPNNPSKYDILEKFAHINTTAQHLFNEIKKHRDAMNFAIYRLPFNRAQTSSQYKLHSRAVTVLKVNDFLKQLRKQHIEEHELFLPPNAQAFIINPELIRCENYKHSRRIWRNLK